MAVIGVAINLFIGDVKAFNMLISALVGGGVFLLLAIISRGGFGGGDIKFMSMPGTLAGNQEYFYYIVVHLYTRWNWRSNVNFTQKENGQDKFPYKYLILPYLLL